MNQKQVGSCHMERDDIGLAVVSCNSKGGRERCYSITNAGDRTNSDSRCVELDPSPV